MQNDITVNGVPLGEALKTRDILEERSRTERVQLRDRRKLKLQSKTDTTNGPVKILSRSQIMITEVEKATNLKDRVVGTLLTGRTLTAKNIHAGIVTVCGPSGGTLGGVGCTLSELTSKTALGHYIERAKVKGVGLSYFLDPQFGLTFKRAKELARSRDSTPNPVKTDTAPAPAVEAKVGDLTIVELINTCMKEGRKLTLIIE